MTAIPGIKLPFHAVQALDIVFISDGPGLKSEQRIFRLKSGSDVSLSLGSFLDVDKGLSVLYVS
ncbi:hypothetical protein N1I81_10020 [Bacillus sp. FSL M8-0052]